MKRVCLDFGLGLVFLACLGATLADPDTIHATTPRWRDPLDKRVVPDPVHIADSAVGIALARCVRSEFLQYPSGISPTALPALFKLERLLAGSAPDTFTVRSPGYYYQVNQRCVLLLTRPPDCVRSIPARHTRYAEDFRTIHVPQITGELPSLVPGGEQIEAAARIAASLWGASRASRRDLQKRVLLWLTPRDDYYGPSPGTEALLRHPELLDGVLRDTLLRLVRRRTFWWDRERAARALAARPDSATRAMAQVLARGDEADRYIAVLVAANDTLSRTREWLVSMLEDRNDLVAEGAIRALQPDRPADRLALITAALRWEALVRRLASQPSATAPPDSDGTMLVDANHLRTVALQRLRSDTSAVVREAIGRALREPSHLSEDDADFLFFDDDSLATCWTDAEVGTSLSDPASRVRELACREAGRRRDRSAGRIILRLLLDDRFPNGGAIPPEEATSMVRTLGAIGDTTALQELVRRVDLPRFFEPFAGTHPLIYWMRQAAVEALGSFDDPRARTVLRTIAESTLADTTCDPNRRDLLWHLAAPLADIGDSTDVRFFRSWAERCPDNLDGALRGLAMLAGPVPMFEYYDVILKRDPDAAHRVRIGTWLADACRRYAERHRN